MLAQLTHMALKSELLVRNQAEGLKNSWLVLEKWVFLLAAGEELDLCVLQENVQSFAVDPSTVFYWFVLLAFSEKQCVRKIFKTSPPGRYYFPHAFTCPSTKGFILFHLIYGFY